jgi:hypothetical protein
VSKSKNIKGMVSKTIFINGEPTAYTINAMGQVYSNHTKQYLKPFKNPGGYLIVDLHHNKKSYYRQVHRLVAEAFIPNPYYLPTVNHKNGDKENNIVENLEWMSIKDNVRHAWRVGLARPRYGTDNPANKYTEEQIHLVCQYLEFTIIHNYEIARLCDVDVTTIRDIKFRGKWKKIADLYNINRKKGGLQSYRKDIERLILEEYMDDDNILIELELPESARIHIRFIRAKLVAASTTIPGGSTPTS